MGCTISTLPELFRCRLHGNEFPSELLIQGTGSARVEQNFGKPLTAKRLFGWHAALFPTGRSGLHKIRVGAWRDDAKGPMRVVSGPLGHERVHYEGPAAGRLEAEMTGFIDWANRQSNTDLVLKAAIAHLWFVTIHPFDDGNGRIARAIADGLLAQSERSAQRFYSMSAQIRQERNAYYAVLEETQKGTLDITGWMEWLLGCLDRAFGGTETTLATVRVIHGRKRKRERTAARSQWAVGRGQRAAGSKQA